MRCTRCKKEFGGILNILGAGMNSPLCPRCGGEVADGRQRAAEEAARLAKEDARAMEIRGSSVLLTTTPAVDGRRVAEYVGIESVEIVIGTGVFSELTGDIADFFGQRSKAFEGKLRQAKDLAFKSLRLKAARRGADAVIAVDLDYTEFSGNRVALIVNGTMVKLATEFGDDAAPARAAELPPILAELADGKPAAKAAPPPMPGRRRLLGEVPE